MSRFTAILVAALLTPGATVALSACGGGDESDTATTPIEATAPT